MRNKEKRRDSESDILLSDDDDELLEANPGPQRNGLVANT